MTRHITLLWRGKLSIVAFVKLGKVCHCFIEIAAGRYYYLTFRAEPVKKNTLYKEEEYSAFFFNR